MTTVLDHWVDGKPWTGESDGAAAGFWLDPTLIDNVPTSSEVYRDEIFGPVLSVVRVEGFEAGVDVINASPHGNGVAIFTNDGGAAWRFQRQVTVGMIGVNVPIPVPVAYHSLPGEGDHLTVARSEPRRYQSRVPAEQLDPRDMKEDR
jgi:malonate-semialdehyde dehydrogenase (acetylating)/methylmalonate-semialdehyde dehydrogenase